MAALLATGLVACIDLTVDPKSIGAIEFVAPSMPSVIVGDTLRDSTGAPEQLVAKVFTSDGDQVAGAPATFVSIDSLVTIVGGSFVVASAGVTGTSTLYASVGSLQSAARQLQVINRPDTVAAGTALQDTILYFQPLTGTLDDSLTSVGVVVRDTAGAPVRAVLVSFRLVYRGVALAPADTGTYALLNDNSRPSRVDTTDATGAASRRVRFRARAGVVTRDTIVVEASVKALRQPLKGSPVSFTLLVLPRLTP
ncbi:MAG: hypothetical protein ABIZ91_02360 [Gemmatimonadaceae bacterium]